MQAAWAAQWRAAARRNLSYVNLGTRRLQKEALKEIGDVTPPVSAPGGSEHSAAHAS
jgi:hypothetical protein